MDREQAIKEMKDAIEVGRDGDQEMAHVQADDILCALLKSLGYGDVLEQYYKVSKWYAQAEAQGRQ